MTNPVTAAFVIAMALMFCPETGGMAAQPESEGTQMQRAGLIPNYPADRNCSPLTSLYMSWIDVDGSARDEAHSGVDGGRLGDAILAPAAGVVVAAWRADWSWGPEGALLIQHDRSDLGLPDGPNHYYSEFDHLRVSDIRSFAVGQRIKRGQILTTVFRPGGKRRYPPEVHWEVWTIDDPTATEWQENEYGRPYWVNKTGHLIDPLSMLGLNAPPRTDGSVDIPAFERGRDYREFRGFTYILPCRKKKVGRATQRGK